MNPTARLSFLRKGGTGASSRGLRRLQGLSLGGIRGLRQARSPVRRGDLLVPPPHAGVWTVGVGLGGGKGFTQVNGSRKDKRSAGSGFGPLRGVRHKPPSQIISSWHLPPVPFPNPGAWVGLARSENSRRLWKRKLQAAQAALDTEFLQSSRNSREVSRAL